LVLLLLLSRAPLSQPVLFPALCCLLGVIRLITSPLVIRAHARASQSKHAFVRKDVLIFADRQQQPGPWPSGAFQVRSPGAVGDGAFQLL
jgi:hypothetical protein